MQTGDSAQSWRCLQEPKVPKVMETVGAPKPKPLRMTILAPFACLSPVIVSASTRVPWLFVFYKTVAKQKARLRVKPVGEENKENTGPDSATVPKHTFLASENAWGMPFDVQSGN